MWSPPPPPDKTVAKCPITWEYLHRGGPLAKHDPFLEPVTLGGVFIDDCDEELCSDSGSVVQLLLCIGGVVEFYDHWYS